MNAATMPYLDRPRPRTLQALADTGEAAFERPVSLTPMAGHSGTLISLERRTFFHGCLALWLSRFCQEFGAVVISDLQDAAINIPFDQAVAVIIGIGDPSGDAGWLEEQISWLRARNPDLPVALLADAAHHEEVEELAIRLGLQGHIPTSTCVGVAAAAARLIVAGGSYFPRTGRGSALAPLLSANDVEESPIAVKVAERLTPREDAVLELLSRGTPNKIIAYRLGISLSTAKVHVHNIIKKLSVRNRTEVALIARRLRHRAPSHAANIDY